MRYLYLILLLLAIAGCGPQVNNHYTITGSHNTLRCDSAQTPNKTVDIGATASTAVGSASTSGQAVSGAK